ncbi:MAG: class I SAM-dependent methyltransferase, partial [Bacteroidales bacterium]
RLLPLAGWLFTGEKAAYRYLRDSVAGFPAPQAICDEMKTAGFKEIKFTRFVPGVAVLFTGLKKS